MAYTYHPAKQLHSLFPDAQSLNNIDAVLAHIAAHKRQSARAIDAEASAYPVSHKETAAVAESYLALRSRAAATQRAILAMTSGIQQLDTVKKNLVLSMTVLKRLQMLVSSYNSLLEVSRTREYAQIAAYLGAVRELLAYFKPYRSIDDIGLLFQQIHKTQNKIVEDVFIDFEDSFTNAFSGSNLVSACEVLELVDPKHKDRLLLWFYNLQLKDIQSIFTASDEAGHIENLGRRYTYFENTLTNVRTHFLHVFPASWLVDAELAKLFCKLTRNDLALQLEQLLAAVTLDALTRTLELEKHLNELLDTSDFTGIILSVFEPHLGAWVKEQDGVLAAKFMEFYASPKLPAELVAPQTHSELLAVVRVNNVPNFSASLVELFKLYLKLLGQIVKLSTGPILVDLAQLFAKYLGEYHNNILLPVFNQCTGNSRGFEPVKYLTMVLNTADYVNNSANDLQDKFSKLVAPKYASQIDFEASKSMFFDLISNSVKALVQKTMADLLFLWRLFENHGWGNVTETGDVSNYMVELLRTLTQDNQVILPLVIRDGYVRSYCDRLVESIVLTFILKLPLVTPLNGVALDQLLIDVAALKKYLLAAPLYSDPQFKEDTEKEPPKGYTRVVNTQFAKIETLLKLLGTSVLPVDDVVERYFELVGDKSWTNFSKFLTLKGIEKGSQQKYIDSFKLQLTIANQLPDESPIFASIEEGAGAATHPALQPPPQQFDIRDILTKSPEPHLPEFFRSNQRIPSLKLNNPLRDFSVNGETHVNKINENIKSLGKFFRKDHNSGTA